MRKPRDFDAALRALTDKTKALKENKRRQLGELVVATGADMIDVEILAGGLLTIVESTNKAQKEAWRQRGVAFFQGQSRQSADRRLDDKESSQPDNNGPTSS